MPVTVKEALDNRKKGLPFAVKSDNVNVANLDERILAYIDTLEPKYQQMLLATSGNDGDIHSKNSRHYKNRAIDFSFNKEVFDRTAFDPVRKKMGIVLLDPNHGTAPHLHLSVGEGTENALDVWKDYKEGDTAPVRQSTEEGFMVNNNPINYQTPSEIKEDNNSSQIEENVRKILEEYLAQNAQQQEQQPLGFELKENLTQQEPEQEYQPQDMSSLYNYIDIDTFQDGGSLPISKNGLYDYPKQTVIVPTKDGKITMKGIDYPVLGISDTGERILMQPNKEYHFKGATEVLEIPQFQDGGELTDKSDYVKQSTEEETYKKIDHKALGLIRDFTPEKNKERFTKIHKNSKGTCLAGALNCGTGGDRATGYGYLNEFLPQMPSLRSYLDKGDISKYKTKDVTAKDIKNWVPNQSIDAWEIHQYLRGEKIGFNPFEKVNFTYEKNGFFPDQLLENENYKKIPIGTIIGQGDVNKKAQYEDYNKVNEVTGRNRHAMVVIGYDKKDGMPIIYDYGSERRLDLPMFTHDPVNGYKKITNFTTPNDYKNVTYETLKNYNNYKRKELGWGENDKITFTNKTKEVDEQSLKAIEGGVNQHAKKISTYYNVPKSTIEKIAKYLPGLSFKETKLNNNEGLSYDNFLPTSISDSWIGNNIIKPVGKGLENAYTEIENNFKDNKNKKQDWQLEVEAYKKYGEDKEKRDKYLKKLKGNNTGKEKVKNNYESSVGAFKIKDMSEYLKKEGITKDDLYGMKVSNKDELKNGSAAALSLLTEKYLKAKELHPNLNEDQLVKLSIIGYSNNSKLTSKDFVDYYIKKEKTNMYDDTFEKIQNFSSKIFPEIKKENYTPKDNTNEVKKHFQNLKRFDSKNKKSRDVYQFKTEADKSDYVNTNNQEYIYPLPNMNDEMQRKEQYNFLFNYKQ